MVSTVSACVQKQSCTDTKVRPALAEQKKGGNTVTRELDVRRNNEITRDERHL